MLMIRYRTYVCGRYISSIRRSNGKTGNDLKATLFGSVEDDVHYRAFFLLNNSEFRRGSYPDHAAKDSDVVCWSDDVTFHLWRWLLPARSLCC